ncbi:MAG: cytochrome c oxidase assembly protein [Betaproteobacteria bacterium HGW-Betaproteobacteria-12]|nr:MAG: cytochrome c oxidase assembly protein [Betaproteobacteria bacterium HGW-Betaproteobacteria-12]
MDQAAPPPVSHKRLIGRLLLMVAAAFAFAFALVPLYNVLCEVTGFNGKTAGQGSISKGFGVGGLKTAAGPASAVDLERRIRVEFTGTVMPGLPWDMRPLTLSLEVHPGELQQVSYLVRNTSDRPITGQAVPSVSPGQAAQHFEKIECFCFSQQTLAPGESMELPLAFIVKPEVDRDISQITLSYAFFSIDGQRQTLTSGEAQ